MSFSHVHPDARWPTSDGPGHVLPQHCFDACWRSVFYMEPFETGVPALFGSVPRCSCVDLGWSLLAKLLRGDGEDAVWVMECVDRRFLYRHRVQTGAINPGKWRRRGVHLKDKVTSLWELGILVVTRFLNTYFMDWNTNEFLNIIKGHHC